MSAPRVRSLHRLLSSLIALFGLSHLYAAYHPSVSNWGFHPLAFGPDGVKWLIPAIMILLALPRVQYAGLRMVRCTGRALLSLPGYGRSFAAAAGILLAGALFALFHSAGIPGDGQFLIHNLHQITGPTDIAHVYLHEPLTCLIIWFVARFAVGDITDPGAESAFRIVSITCGIVFILLLPAVVRRLVRGRTERMLGVLFVTVSGTSMLFFGHIENYTIALLGVLVFVLLGLRHTAGESPLWAPAAAAGILVPLYFGMMVILPVLGTLFLAEYRERRSLRPLATAAVTFLVVSLGLMALTGFTPDRFMLMLTGGGKHMIGIVESAGAMEGYTLFSVRHLTDLANLLLMIAPFGIILIAVLALIGRDAELRTAPLAGFIPILALCSAALLVLFRCDLGMPRDWDLLSPFMFGAVVLPVLYTAGRVRRGEDVRVMLFAASAATLVHIVPWILLDHDHRQAVAQNRLVLEQSGWIEGIHKGYEGLAMSSKMRGEYDSAAVFYRKFLDSDPTHQRILGNLADVYRILGMEDSEMEYTERAIRYGSTVPALYFNLGVIYAQRERYEDAIRVMLAGLRLEPRRADVLNSVGAFILRSRSDCGQAMYYFGEAIRADSSYAMAYLNAGECALAAGDTASMRSYFTAYATLDPGGALRQGVIRRLRSGSAP